MWIHVHVRTQERMNQGGVSSGGVFIAAVKADVDEGVFTSWQMDRCK